MSFDFIDKDCKKIHFIGIGGISMSGLAEISIDKNYDVSGSDMKSSEITEKLARKGAKIYIGHNGNNIKDADLVVYTAAISKNNPELVKARENNIKMMDRAEFLGNIMRGYKHNIAVSGTHGKTTVTSMISYITMDSQLDPTILVGGKLDLIGGNVRSGKSDYFIAEACEYKASFLKFYPTVGVILNIEADHLDYYKDINDIKSAFSKFAHLVPDKGYIVAYSEDNNVQDILKGLKCNIITYGFTKGDITAANIKFNEKGCASFDVFENTSKLFSIQLNVPGKHNILNALASICTCKSLNIPDKNIVNGLMKFKGTHRRFEIKGIKNGITVIDDYAHHPTEIKATLNAAASYPHKRIFCVFQPHTYSRTLTLFKDFINAFDNTDMLILADIYAAREKDTGIISSDMLGDSIRKRGIKCINLHSFDKIKDYLSSELSEGDLLLTVGAGDIYKVGEMFLES